MKALFPYAESTHGITVRVAVTYLPEQSEPDRKRWFWSYHIRIENEGDAAVQLLTRHWIIVDASGHRHIVDGEGVVGEQPLIFPGDSYDYVSGCPLETPTGTMQGSYHVMGQDGAMFEVRIPRFLLTAPVTAT